MSPTHYSYTLKQAHSVLALEKIHKTINHACDISCQWYSNTKDDSDYFCLSRKLIVKSLKREEEYKVNHWMAHYFIPYLSKSNTDRNNPQKDKGDITIFRSVADLFVVHKITYEALNISLCYWGLILIFDPSMPFTDSGMFTLFFCLLSHGDVCFRFDFKSLTIVCTPCFLSQQVFLCLGFLKNLFLVFS